MGKTNVSRLTSKATGTTCLRVVCVHDSSVVHAHLDQVLTKEQGFQIVFHAKNTNEAEAYLRTFTADLMTLDSQLVKETAVDYLQRAYTGNHPAVIIVSQSLAGEEELLARALNFGSSAVFKISKTKNILNSAVGFREQLRQIHLAKKNSQSPQAGIDEKIFAQFGLSLTPEAGVHIIAVDERNLDVIQDYLISIRDSGMPMLFLFSARMKADPKSVSTFTGKIQQVMKKEPCLLNMVMPKNLNPSDIYYGFDSVLGNHLKSIFPGFSLAVQVLSPDSFPGLLGLQNLPDIAFFYNEEGIGAKTKMIVGKVVPLSSMPFLAINFLKKSQSQAA